MINYTLSSNQGDILIPAKTKVMYDDLELMGRGFESWGDEFNHNMIKLKDSISSVKSTLLVSQDNASASTSTSIDAVNATIINLETSLNAAIDALYTKAEVDSKIVELAPATDISGKADKATTIGGYGITDGYTKTEVEAKIVELSPPADLSTVYSKEEADAKFTDTQLTDSQIAAMGYKKTDNDTTYTNVSEFTNDAGYLTTHQDISGKADKSQVLTDVPTGAVFTDTETTTNLAIVGNTLQYTDEEGAITSIDLSLYLDDTNLSKLVSGSLSPSGVATFTRDDNSSFTVDFSQFFDDTNLARITSGSTSGSDITLTRDDASTVTIDASAIIATAVAGANASASAAGYLTTHQDISGKVDKVAGKGLSTEDFTTVEKTKLSNALTEESVTTMSVVGNTLKYVNESGETTLIDLSAYLDDTNLARIVNGTYDAVEKELIFTRDDGSTFKIDASMFFDDTNLVTSVNGQTGAVTVPAYSHPTHPGDDMSVDTGALTGATVISDLDFNVTTDTNGHVTDANATVSTRNLTAGDVGALPVNGKASDSDKLDGLDSTQFARQYRWTPGSSAGTRRWVKLFTISDHDSSITGIFGSAGDYGDYDRGQYNLLIGTRSSGITMDVYTLNKENQVEAPEFYTKDIGSNYEVWVYLADYNQPQYFTKHSQYGAVTVHEESTATTTSPSGVIASSNKIWHSGNDGTGSGLDADKLDGQHAVDIIAAAVTEASASAGSGLGVGQSWTKYTPGTDRVRDIIYTNSTGNPIQVIITTYPLNTHSYVYVDGVEIGHSIVGSGSYAKTAYSFIVPNGSTYEVTCPKENTSWAELR